MRGKQRLLALKHVGYGITPADAGKTQFFAFAPRRDQDHPRGCGENLSTYPSWAAKSGSPPRMRGKHLHRRNDVRYTRITPADAGKTRLQRRINMPKEDHPRGCGENIDNLPLLLDAVGSPPRMRGKH